MSLFPQKGFQGGGDAALRVVPDNIRESPFDLRVGIGWGKGSDRMVCHRQIVEVVSEHNGLRWGNAQLFLQGLDAGSFGYVPLIGVYPDKRSSLDGEAVPRKGFEIREDILLDVIECVPVSADRRFSLYYTAVPHCSDTVLHQQPCCRYIT